MRLSARIYHSLSLYYSVIQIVFVATWITHNTQLKLHGTAKHSVDTRIDKLFVEFGCSLTLDQLEASASIILVFRLAECEFVET